MKYKRTAKTKISPVDQRTLLQRLHRARLEKSATSIKGKLKIKSGDKVEPGEMFNRAKAMNARNKTQQSDGVSKPLKVAIAGAV